MKHPEIDTIYSRLIKSVLEDGKEGATPRGSKVKELYNVGWTLEDARNGIVLSPIRKINLAYAVIEMLGLFRTGLQNVKPYCYYNSVMEKFLNANTGQWDGSYAQRLQLYDQVPKMYKILKDDPDSRRAVISFYNPEYDFHNYESKDICCTLNLIFRLRGGKLHLSCTMRSNDVILGVPYDLTQFTFLQSVLAAWLGVEMGEYYHYAANLHIYEQDYEKAKKISEGKWIKEGLLPRMPKWDVESVYETYKQIDAFFAIEEELRETENPTEYLIDKECEMRRLTSAVLKNFLTDIILPYIIRKQNKNKAS